ncbi:hypothetical protein EDC96DRAFT_480868 [Choanephora cucurbitarum]|nr:hypothetical protein EDC96DRAFT_480868 [Choanephora cucurbitarum]
MMESNLMLTEDSDTYEDGFSSKRCSTSSSLTTLSHNLLESKIQALEQQLEHRIQKEIALESQLIILQQQLQDKTNQPLSRISKRINSFLSHKEQQKQQQDFSFELKRDTYQNILFDDHQDYSILTHLFSPSAILPVHSEVPSNASTSVFLHRLKFMVQEFNKSEHPALIDIGMDLHCLIESWETHYSHTIANKLAHVQEEKEEYETTVEMMRREMEGMLEELEDMRQQRTRYKQQAARLRESVQKRIQHDEMDEEKEKEEATQLLYREAERQANDLDRECKRQSLALISLRNELKSTEQKYQSIKLETNKRLIQLEQLNQVLTWELKQTHDLAAKEYGLEKALEAAIAEASLLRTRIYQLERQEGLTKLLFQDINRIEFVLLSKTQPSKQIANYLELADRIEIEQRQWKQENRKLLKRQYDIDALRMHRESRELASQMSELEYEVERMKEAHKKELALCQHQANANLERQLQQSYLTQKIKEQELRDQLEVSFQKNQTLQQESLVLYGRNLLLTSQLGKITF